MKSEHKTEHRNDKKSSETCSRCGGTGIIRRPLTVGELIENFPNIMKTLYKVSDIEKFKVHSFFLSEKKISFPRIGTEASMDFFYSIAQINSFFTFLLELVSKVDYIAELTEQIITTSKWWKDFTCG